MGNNNITMNKCKKRIMKKETTVTINFKEPEGWTRKIEKPKYVFLHNISGITKLFRYSNGIMIGMCFEYAYRVESDVWYLPLAIGILLSISMVMDILSSYR